MACGSICLSSCGSASRERDDAAQAFRSVYLQLPDPKVEVGVIKSEEKKITLTAVGVPLVDLLRQISDECGISVIASGKLDADLVSLEIKSASAETVLGAVARRLGQRIAKIGNIYYIGDISPEDRGFIVRRIHRLKSEELSHVVALFTSEYGKTVSFSDGLMVVSDRVEVLDRLNSALDKLENVTSATWVVQVYLISLTDKHMHDLGIDLSNTLKLSYKVNSSSSEGGSVSGTLDALLVSAHEDGDSTVVAQPLLLVRDGGQAHISDGTEQPVPKYTNLVSGNLELSGFEIISVGLKCDVSCREETQKSAQLELSVELSKISGYVSNYPIVSKQRLVSDLSIRSGGEYLVGQLVESSRLDQLSGNVIPSQYKWENNRSNIQVWAKAFRISGTPVLRPTLPEVSDVAPPAGQATP